jgi:hypothetical protein
MARRKSKQCKRRNKQNSYLNGEWGAMQAWGKRLTAHLRRQLAKLEIKDRLENE